MIRLSEARGILARMLSDRQQAVLDFARKWEGRTGAKAFAIRAELDVAPARYYQELAAIVRSVEGIRADPGFAYREQERADRAAAARRERRIA